MRRTRTPENCGKTVSTSLSLSEASDRSIDKTHSTGIREGLMDSGNCVSILNLSTCRKVLSLLRSITGQAWGLETDDCKTREILYFPPFL